MCMRKHCPPHGFLLRKHAKCLLRPVNCIQVTAHTRRVTRATGQPWEGSHPKPTPITEAYTSDSQQRQPQHTNHQTLAPRQHKCPLWLTLWPAARPGSALARAARAPTDAPVAPHRRPHMPPAAHAAASSAPWKRAGTRSTGARAQWHHGRSDAPCGSRCSQQRVLKALWHAQHGRARAQPAHIAQLPAGRHLVVAAAVAHRAHVARLDQDAAEGLDLRCTRTGLRSCRILTAWQ